jgi:hypothetical protein
MSHNSLKPEIIETGYVNKAMVFMAIDRNTIDRHEFDPDRHSLDEHVAGWYSHNPNIALARFYKAATVLVRHPAELFPKDADPNTHGYAGGRLQTLIGDKPYIPIPEMTKYVTGMDLTGLPMFESADEIIRGGVLTPHLERSLGLLALADEWGPEFSDLLPVIPGHPKSAEEYKDFIESAAIL